MEIRLDTLKEHIDEKIDEAVKDLKHDFIEAMRAEIMELQTYKLFEGEEDVYIERDDVLKIFEKHTEGDEENDNNKV